MARLGCLVGHALRIGSAGYKKRIPVNVNKMVKKWKEAVVGLCMAHGKDEADRFEASSEEYLMPILSAPIRQIREFAPKLLEVLKSDADTNAAICGALLGAVYGRPAIPRQWTKCLLNCRPAA